MMDARMFANLLAWSGQIAVLAGAAGLVLSLLRVHAPSIRYGFWRMALGLCLLLPVLQPWHPLSVASVDATTIDLPATALSSPDAAANSRRVQPGAAARMPSAWPFWIAGVLVAGAVLRLAWLAAGLLHLRRLRRAGAHAAPDDGHDELKVLTEAGAEIRVVDEIRQPVTFGLMRPVVLLPARLSTLPAHVQRAVVAHELWHVRRRDWAWILCEEVVRAAFWFHPAMWWLVSRVQSSREEVVDELTVVLINSRRSYLEALLAFADEPVPFPATPFARRRHLFQRMLLISKEAAMSSRRIVASGAAMTLGLVVAGWSGVWAFPLISNVTAENAGITSARQQPPRDPRPDAARAETSREMELHKAIVADPANTRAYLDLAKLQEARGARQEAESTLQALRRAAPSSTEALRALAGFYNRTGRFDDAVAAVKEIAALEPSNPAGYQLVATFYWEKAFKDQSLSPVDKLTYIELGIEATDHALALNPDYVEALTYKNILLRMKANMETVPVVQQALIDEANELRNRAIALNKNRPQSATRRDLGAPPPPPPPPPPDAPSEAVDGVMPYRIGGNIPQPIKVRDVRPVYPHEARDARVQGVVIIEATIDALGNVRDTRVLRSIPILDQAAVEAVSQWQFTPTVVNDQAVPVIMTVTVNFTLQ